MHRGLLISEIKPGSPAEKAGLKAGDRLLKINGSHFYDILDFHYLCAERRLSLQVGKSNGTVQELIMRKNYDEDPGIVFFSPVLGPLRYCRNHCIFCFVDQQPPAMRPSLYEKDDDYRLSFFHGNYISLTNMGKLDIKRIIRRRLSPLYISVHATDPAVRRKMMGNKNAGEILKLLGQLARGGIKMHGQVVLCPGYNDEAVLERTISDLAELFPEMKSVALVPVGLTRYREGLAPLRSITPAEAREIVEKYSTWQEHFCREKGEPFIYLADEFYLLSDYPLPPHRHYGNYPQLENGVGLARLFLNELDKWKKAGIPKVKRYGEISLLCAKAAEPLLKELVKELHKVSALKTHLHIIPHFFWGGNVTVTGLLTGSDLIRELSGKKNLGEALFISRSMLKEGSRLFLDNLSLDYVSGKLKVRIIPVEGPLELRRLLTAPPATEKVKGGNALEHPDGGNCRPSQCR
ncbi:MAG: DUF512 domain-containing protein [Firmicutes bacterium]|nr:DUF512 domain-containing protein [Bacillota bacterium]